MPRQLCCGNPCEAMRAHGMRAHVLVHSHTPRYTQENTYSRRILCLKVRGSGRGEGGGVGEGCVGGDVAV